MHFLQTTAENEARKSLPGFIRVFCPVTECMAFWEFYQNGCLGILMSLPTSWFPLGNGCQPVGCFSFLIWAKMQMADTWGVE